MFNHLGILSISIFQFFPLAYVLNRGEVDIWCQVMLASYHLGMSVFSVYHIFTLVLGSSGGSYG